MCLNTWSFRPVNVDKISCTNCVLRWTWEAQHKDPSEHYENCIDVTISNPPDSGSYSAHSGYSGDYSEVSYSAEPTHAGYSGDYSEVSYSAGTTETDGTSATSEPTNDENVYMPNNAYKNMQGGILGLLGLLFV
jgi:hypothetical protein